MKTEYKHAVDLKPYGFGIEPITAVGYKRQNGIKGFDINTSSILTKLIQEAGRYCESFASDLFIYWKGIDEMLQGERLLRRIKMFGFRENGIDNSDDITCVLQHDPNHKEYRSIWRLDTEVDGDRITMKLYRVD